MSPFANCKVPAQMFEQVGFCSIASFPHISIDGSMLWSQVFGVPKDKLHLMQKLHFRHMPCPITWRLPGSLSGSLFWYEAAGGMTMATLAPSTTRARKAAEALVELDSQPASFERHLELDDGHVASVYEHPYLSDLFVSAVRLRVRPLYLDESEFDRFWGTCSEMPKDVFGQDVGPFHGDVPDHAGSWVGFVTKDKTLALRGPQDIILPALMSRCFPHQGDCHRKPVDPGVIDMNGMDRREPTLPTTVVQEPFEVPEAAARWLREMEIVADRKNTYGNLLNPVVLGQVVAEAELHMLLMPFPDRATKEDRQAVKQSIIDSANAFVWWSTEKDKFDPDGFHPFLYGKNRVILCPDKTQMLGVCKSASCSSCEVLCRGATMIEATRVCSSSKADECQS